MNIWISVTKLHKNSRYMRTEWKETSTMLKDASQKDSSSCRVEIYEVWNEFSTKNDTFRLYQENITKKLSIKCNVFNDIRCNWILHMLQWDIS